MESGRVGACHRLENKRRKFLIVINDVVKSKYEEYAKRIKSAHLEAEHDFDKSSMYVRRALARQKVLQKCMKMGRRKIDNKNVFGRYGGKQIASFGRDIESFITYNHPKMRRNRYLNKLLNESLEKGAILKENSVKDRVAGWIERSCTKYKPMTASREISVLYPIKESDERRSEHGRKIITRLQVLSNPIYSGVRDVPANTDQDTEADVLKLTDNIGKVEINTDTNEHLAKSVDDLKASRRRTLVLPPIQSTRVMMATRFV